MRLMYQSMDVVHERRALHSGEAGFTGKHTADSAVLRDARPDGLSLSHFYLRHRTGAFTTQALGLSGAADCGLATAMGASHDSQLWSAGVEQRWSSGTHTHVR